ncbi:MAG: hypothetical protein KJT03_13990 [Verrucomicrobiae bacterium]|nr:hypothetical protein [Verrucomicrobiae bacterium]
MSPLDKSVFYFLSFICLALRLSGEEELDLTAQQQEQLLNGEVLFLEPDGNNMLKAVIRIEAAPEFVWNIMLDHERVPEYVKQLRRIKVLEQGKNWKVIEHRLKMHTLVPTFTYVFREEYTDDYEIAFSRVRGAFKDITGYWKLVPRKSKDDCLLVYSTYVDFGWLVPKSWIRHAIDKQVPVLLQTFRDVVTTDLEDKGS